MSWYWYTNRFTQIKFTKMIAFCVMFCFIAKMCCVLYSLGNRVCILWVFELVMSKLSVSVSVLNGEQRCAIYVPIHCQSHSIWMVVERNWNVRTHSMTKHKRMNTCSTHSLFLPSLRLFHILISVLRLRRNEKYRIFAVSVMWTVAIMHKHSINTQKPHLPWIYDQWL